MRIPALIVVFAALAACSSEGGYKLPGVYRIDVQQGNVITQDMMDKLKPGMDKNQVRFVMGTPAIEDPFHTDRWDYLYSISEGGKRRDQLHVALYFKDDKLTHVDGNVVAAANKTRDELKPRPAPVEVELKDHNPGFFSRLFNALPFVGEDKAPKTGAKTAAEEETAKPAAEAEQSAAPAESPRQESGQTAARNAAVADPGLPQQDATAETEPAVEPEGAVNEAATAVIPGANADPSGTVPGHDALLKSEKARQAEAVFGPDPEPEPLPEPDQELPSEEM